MDLEDIRLAVANQTFRVTDHADEEMVADALSLDDVLESTTGGEIIEDYPTDHPLPSCLVYGQSVKGQHIHSVWAYNAKSGRAVLVTAYCPDPNRWTNWRVRKR